MQGYTKLFSSIVSSTIWQEDLPTKVVWITMLAMSDSDGNVEGSVPGLAHLAGVSLEECERSLAKLQEPDKFSRTPTNEGRRIEVIDGGWFIVNRAKYRDLIPEESRRERDRLRQQRYRAKLDATFTLSRVTECDSHDLLSPSPQKEKEKEKEESKAMPFAPPSLEEVMAFCKERKNQVDPEKFHAYYEANGWYAGRVKMRNWRAAVVKWERDNYGGPFQSGYQKSPAQLRSERQSAAIDAAFAALDTPEEIRGPVQARTEPKRS